MMIYSYSRRSKQKKQPKAVREQYEQWVQSHKPSKTLVLPKNQKLTGYSLSAPAGRETKHIPSLNTGETGATKAASKVYTGDKVLGIATLHKSNAVPVFNSQEAVDISSMRR